MQILSEKEDRFFFIKKKMICLKSHENNRTIFYLMVYFHAWRNIGELKNRLFVGSIKILYNFFNLLLSGDIAHVL